VERHPSSKQRASKNTAHPKKEASQPAITARDGMWRWLRIACKTATVQGTPLTSGARRRTTRTKAPKESQRKQPFSQVAREGLAGFARSLPPPLQLRGRDCVRTNVIRRASQRMEVLPPLHELAHTKI
jgi:hypothetical protein